MRLFQAYPECYFQFFIKIKIILFEQSLSKSTVYDNHELFRQRCGQFGRKILLFFKIVANFATEFIAMALI